MTRRTDKIGYQSGGKGGDRWLSPQNPQTGDGKTRRKLFDGAIRLVFKAGREKPNGS